LIEAADVEIGLDVTLPKEPGEPERQEIGIEGTEQSNLHIALLRGDELSFLDKFDEVSNWGINKGNASPLERSGRHWFANDEGASSLGLGDGLLDILNFIADVVKADATAERTSHRRILAIWLNEFNRHTVSSICEGDTYLLNLIVDDLSREANWHSVAVQSGLLDDIVHNDANVMQSHADAF